MVIVDIFVLFSNSEEKCSIFSTKLDVSIKYFVDSTVKDINPYTHQINLHSNEKECLSATSTMQ